METLFAQKKNPKKNIVILPRASIILSIFLLRRIDIFRFAKIEIIASQLQYDANPLLRGSAYRMHRIYQGALPISKIPMGIYIDTQRASRLVRYLRTIRATLKTMAWSNWRRSRPVSFLIFSRRYTRVLRWTKSYREVSETFRLFSKNLLMVKRVSWSRDSMEFFLKTSLRKISQRVVGS